MTWIFYLLGLIFFEMVADVLAKEWSLGRPLMWAVGALFFFLVCNTFWLLALKSGAGLARGAVFFAVATAASAALLGVIWYHERVGATQAVGIVLGLASIILITRP